MLIQGMQLENKIGADFAQYRIYRLTIDSESRNTAICVAQSYGCNIWDLIQTNLNEWSLIVVLPSATPLHCWIAENDEQSNINICELSAKLTAFKEVDTMNNPVSFSGFNSFKDGIYQP